MWQRIRTPAPTAVLVAVVFAASACTEDPATSEHRESPRAAVSSTAADPKQGARDEAIATYRAMWDDLAVASHTANPEHPRLDDHAVDGALRLLRHGLDKTRQQKLVAKGAPKVNPEVEEASPTERPTSVKLIDCVDSTKWLQYKPNGELSNDVPGGHGKAEATVTYREGRWVVTDLYMHESGTC
ncbi:hypothetical protein [Streptomyces sp. 7N604]|uniref:hypothetical protein n=1 Tax=Streptomyces sp. 7N604 TaxID=3457415 RepID=UPI003FD5757C